MTLEFPLQIFKKLSNIRFDENPSSGSQVVPCERADGQRDTRKQRAVFRNSAEAPKNSYKSKMKIS